MGDEEKAPHDRRKSRVSMMITKEQQSRTRSLANMGRSMSTVRMRRKSYGFGGVPGIRPVERTSQLGIEFKRPPLMWLPTYQLDPHPPFKLAIVVKLTEELLDEHFKDHKYNASESPATALRIAGELMRAVKDLMFNRYRVISTVTIGQKRSQCFNNAISFLWDHERDGYCEVHREVTTAFVQCITYCIYFD